MKRRDFLKAAMTGAAAAAMPSISAAEPGDQIAVDLSADGGDTTVLRTSDALMVGDVFTIDGRPELFTVVEVSGKDSIIKPYLSS